CAPALQEEGCVAPAAASKRLLFVPTGMLPPGIAAHAPWTRFRLRVVVVPPEHEPSVDTVTATVPAVQVPPTSSHLHAHDGLVSARISTSAWSVYPAPHAVVRVSETATSSKPAGARSTHSCVGLHAG